MIKKPIGIFDSGLGGLTAVKELKNLLPKENIVYFGDTGRVPYGNKSKETIVKYAMQDVDFLKSMDVKMIIAACGTVSSVASQLGQGLTIPFTGVVNPTAKAAANATKNGKIGIIGTTATIKSGSFKKELLKINSNFEIYEQDCPLFVPLVENGFIEKDNNVTIAIAEKYLSNLQYKGIDTLILGCTHYPIIKEIISKIVGDETNIIDSGKQTAIFAFEKLQNLSALNTSKEDGECLFFVSDDTEGFAKTANIFLGENINKKVQRIDIEKFKA